MLDAAAGIEVAEADVHRPVALGQDYVGAQGTGIGVGVKAQEGIGNIGNTVRIRAVNQIRVTVFAAIEQVVTKATIEQVGAVAALEGVVARAAIEQVRTTQSLQQVVPVAAQQLVALIIAHQHIGRTGASREPAAIEEMIYPGRHVAE